MKLTRVPPAQVTHFPPLRLRLAAVIGLVAFAALAWWLTSAQNAVDAAVIATSGTIEGEEVAITAEMSGRVERVLVAEGQDVKAGEPLVAFECATLQAQYEQALAAVDVARANLALLQQGSRPEEVRQAEATVAQAAAARDAAKRAWDNAIALRDNPQELNLKIDTARPQVTAAEAAVAQAKANLNTAEQRLEQIKKGPRLEDVAALQLAVEQARNTLWAAQIERDGIKGNPHLPEYQGHAADARVAAAETAVSVANATLAARTAPPTAEELQIAANAVEAARASLSTAEASLVQAQQNLKGLLAIKENPLAPNAQVDVARGQYESAEAALRLAEARLEAVKNGPTLEQLDVARAQVRQAEAAARVLWTQLDEATIKSPIDGIVARVNIHAGELAAPGARLATVTGMNVVDLVVYVPETKIGLARLGQKADVTVDSFPGQTFAGEVVHIASQAEFTPRNVQSQRERANTVFAVRLRIPNADLRLKPGMPADARFRM